MIPLFHDLNDELVLVFGGGSVGARKADRFAAEARVIVVSPRFHQSLETAAADDGSSIELVRGSPDGAAVRDWIERTSPALAIAATNDPEINGAVETAASDAGVLVNRTDRAGERDSGSVVVPATVEDGPVRVAISTGGRSPALSKALRERIQAEIEGAGAMAELSGSLREELKDRDVDPDRRRAAIRAVVRSGPVWKALQEGGSKGRNEAERVIEGVLNE